MYLEKLNFVLTLIGLLFLLLFIIFLIMLLAYVKIKNDDDLIEFKVCKVAGKLKNKNGDNLVTFYLFNGDYLVLKTDLKSYLKLKEGEQIYIKYKRKDLLEWDTDTSTINITNRR